MISDVYDSIVEVFKVYGCPAPVFLGQQFADQHTGTLCVVMWQNDDLFAEALPSVQIWPNQHMYINPRAIKTRRCGLVARMWATSPTPHRSAQDQFRADTAYLDALINQFIVALQHSVPGIYELRGGKAAAGNAAADVAGLGYDLHCLINVPILDAAWPAQGLDKCTSTWVHGRGTAIVNVKAVPVVGGEPYPPNVTFPVPTEE